MKRTTFTDVIYNNHLYLEPALCFLLNLSLGDGHPTSMFKEKCFETLFKRIETLATLAIIENLP